MSGNSVLRDLLVVVLEMTGFVQVIGGRLAETIGLYQPDTEKGFSILRKCSCQHRLCGRVTSNTVSRLTRPSQAFQISY